MNSSLIAIRYAKALLQTGITHEVLPALKQDALYVLDLMDHEALFVQILNSPTVKNEAKTQLVHQLLDSHASTFLIQFLEMVIQHKRQEFLPGMIRHFIRLCNEHENIKHVVLTTAVPLSAERKEAITEILKKTCQSGIEMDTVLSPEIIGGFILNIEEDLYDASLSSQLNRIQQALTQDRPSS